MEQLSAMAFAFSLVGGMHDLFTKKIPNWLTLPAIVLGLVAQVWLFSLGGAVNGVLGVLIGFGLYFPIYALGYMGAGDVKLLMVIGAWTGWRFCFYVAIGAVVIGALYALVEIIYRGRLWAVIRNIYFFLRALFVPGLVAEPLRLDKDRKFAFGICLALSVALLIYLRHEGKFL